MSGVYRTKADLDAALASGELTHARHAELSQYFEKPGNNASASASAIESTMSQNAAHAPAIRALSALVADGKADAADIIAKLRNGASPEFLAEHEGRDLGECVVAVLDGERAFLHTPQPKIETREQAAAEIRKLEANKGDMADQVVAKLLRQQHGIWETL